MGIFDWLTGGGDEDKGPVDMPMSPDLGDGFAGYYGALTDTASDLYGRASSGLAAAAPAIAGNALMSALDGYMMDAPGKGDLFEWLPPGHDAAGKSTEREITVTPLGWGALAATGFLIWVALRA